MPLLPWFLISALLHAWAAWRLAPALAGLLPVASDGIWLWAILSTVLVPLGFLGRRAAGGLVTVLAWLGLVAMGLFSTVLVLTLGRDALLLLAWAADLVLPMGVPLDTVQQWTAAAVPALALAATAWGLWNARRTAAVVQVDVPVPDLPAALHGFTVAQISDVHVGPTIKGRYLQRIVDKVNRLGADMVAITGDLVDGRVADLAPHVAALARLTSRHGTFFVTGNHEYYSGANAWVAELRRLGVKVLMNEHVVLQHPAPAQAGHPPAGSAPLLVAGVTDYSAHHFDERQRSDPQAALRGAPAGPLFRLLLAHQPRSAPAAARAGFDLQLSGHTHGGQFWPWNLFVRFQQPFTAGLNRLQQLWVYTNRGTGYWGPPKRFGVPSEITRLRLVRT
jgi:predicted MPP superfamily phosphohydrolase